MHYRIRYMHVKYQLNRDNRFAKNREHKKYIKLHKFATCNSNFKKSLLSEMHCPTPDIEANFEKNRTDRYSATVDQSYFHERRTDRQTDGRTDGHRE